MPLSAKYLTPIEADRPSSAFDTYPMQVTVLVNGRPVSVTITEGDGAECRSLGRDQAPERASDYLSEG